jgi:hypothetical protein
VQKFVVNQESNSSIENQEKNFLWNQELAIPVIGGPQADFQAPDCA